MGRIIAYDSVTLDGVMQAPGRPDEDTRGGFEHGGWAVPYASPELVRAAGETGATTRALLFGRRTYEDFFRVWPSRTDNPYTDVLNRTHKYVASTTLHEPLPWQNSTLVAGDVGRTIEALRGEPGDLVILGSGELVRSLLALRLIDRFVLLVHPLVLGTGRRLFADGAGVTLRLGDVQPTSTGVIIATYDVV